MSAESLLAQYSSWLLGASTLYGCAPCTDLELMTRLRQSILEDPDLHSSLHSDAFILIASGLQNKADLLPALNDLADAFQTLEQAALHLYLTPWRKEFHTIKTYSGHYVHVLEAALPQDAIYFALSKLGYEPQEYGVCLAVQVQPAPHTLLVAALGFVAAQLECRILADIVLCSESPLVSGTDLMRERRSWRGEADCIERLRKLTVQAPKSPATLDIYQSDCRDSSGDAPLFRPESCDQCHERWDRHANGCCRTVAERLVHTKPPGNLQPVDDRPDYIPGPPVEFTMHDCVFIEKTLQLRCADCHAFHSSSCSIVRGCKDFGHRVTQLTASEKLEAVREEEEKKHQLHVCLQPGQLPHYRCGQCRQLHYIKCPRLLECCRQGHHANMIMLEKDQRLWLQRSLVDTALLSKDC
ncbi:spermatogenesis-associated protein 2-like protein [Pseudophryne corroboree]|uniref:spermatogenesis-associated protein 2-like protein n=1 Tax=Pseudophryne corroboree TaxID=495146 RepID=UPI003081E9F0